MLTWYLSHAHLDVRLGSDNMYACVDLVTDRIRRKLRRFKERKVDETRSRPGVGNLSEQVGVGAALGLASRYCPCSLLSLSLSLSLCTRYPLLLL